MLDPRILIDSDGGADDMLALLMASRLCPQRIAGVSAVFGNVPVEQAARNIAYTLTLGGLVPLPPVGLGAASAADGFRRFALDVHGEDGLGRARKVQPAEPHFEALTLEAYAKAVLARQPPDTQFEILAIGPATNVPQLVELIGPSRISRIVIMAGVLLDRGNITEHAEFNAYNDPQALADVIASSIPVTLVPLDVCRKVILTRRSIAGFYTTTLNEYLRPLQAALDDYADGYEKWEGIDGCFPHDSIALLTLLYPSRFSFLDARVKIYISGDYRGDTTLSCESSAPPVKIVFGGDLKWVRETIGYRWLQDKPPQKEHLRDSLKVK